MEVVLLIFIVIYLLITNKGISTKLKELQTSIFQLDDKLRYLQRETALLENLLKKTEKEKKVKKEEKPVEEIKPIIVTEEPIIVVPKKPEFVEPILSNTTKITPILKTKKPLLKEIKKEEKFIPKKSWIENFKEKNPDLEKFIGENSGMQEG